MNFKIITLGCKVNIYESEIMRELLLQHGYIETTTNCDIIIINTCSVTNMADNKSKKMIRGAKRDSQNAIIIVCGCAAENQREKLDELGIDILIGNQDKSKIIDMIEEYKANNKSITRFYDMQKLEFEDMKVSKFSRFTRAFVKIQDGCNNYCSFCIIPYMRGNIRYKDLDKTYSEVLQLVNNGHQEIVLTGIHTGAYGRGTDIDLVDLIRKISTIKNLHRIRISSIEVTELSEKFLNELKDNRKLCSHMHIPLQAGSNRILKIMNRKYDKEYYQLTIKKLREIRPEISISTDVIVGFPSETNEEFLETLNFCKNIPFTKIHVFPYSKREGTKACEIPNHLENSVKKARAKELIEVSSELEKTYNSHFINTNQVVLIEEVTQTKSIGHTDNFIKVQINEKLDTNTFHCIKLLNNTEEGMIGDKTIEKPKQVTYNVNSR